MRLESRPSVARPGVTDFYHTGRHGGRFLASWQTNNMDIYLCTFNIQALCGFTVYQYQ
jgi:hypothetical protein